MNRMMRNWKILIYAVVLGTMTSCGELFEVNEEAQANPVVTLSDHSIDLMVGVRYQLQATITPETLKDAALYWASDDKDIVKFEDGVAVAVAPGTTDLRVSVVNTTSEDVCHVTVHPRWMDFDPTQFLYDMVVFADVSVNNHPLADGDAVGAFSADGDLRGVGQMLKTTAGKDYMMLRIYSNELSEEDIQLRCFDAARAKVIRAQQTITFYSDETYPSSGLMDLKFD